MNVPVWAIYAELGRLPLHYFWWREVIRFWNQVVGLPEGNIWRDIMLDNCRAGLPPQELDWSGQGILYGIGYSSGALQLEKIDGDEVLQCLLRRYDTVWDSLGRFPRVVTSQVTLTTYNRWMRCGGWLDASGSPSDVYLCQVQAWLSPFGYCDWPLAWRGPRGQAVSALWCGCTRVRR